MRPHSLTVQPRRLLLIEDNADTCEMLKLIFEPHGYLVLTAPDMAGALQVLGNSLIDVFVIDIRLPDGSGIDLCRQLREHDRNTPIVVFSSNEQYRMEALAAGANRFVDKSQSDVLEQTVSTLVEDAESKALSAALAEKAAIQEELQQRTRSLYTLAAKARSTELRLKARAYRAFIEAGGTTAHFKRLWPEAMQEVEV